jgi:hypothetical protein
MITPRKKQEKLRSSRHNKLISNDKKNYNFFFKNNLENQN